MSTIKCTTLQNLSGVEVYTCKAWVNFNGTGTVAIRASGNVSSITDVGVGRYNVNFTTAMPDANYACNVTPSQGGYFGGAGINDGGGYATDSVRVSAVSDAGPYVDSLHMAVAIFR
jgi:hypothetical protein